MVDLAPAEEGFAPPTKLSSKIKWELQEKSKILAIFRQYELSKSTCPAKLLKSTSSKRSIIDKEPRRLEEIAYLRYF